MNPNARRGCIALVVLLLLFAGIYFYFGRESEETAPSPSQGSLPPPGSGGSPKAKGDPPMRPLPGDPPG